MQEEKLRTLIRESIQEYIKEIDEAAETAAMEARIAKCDEAIATREAKLGAIAESDHKDLMDEGKIKGLENEIKELKKAKAKFEKLAEKKAAKKAKKSAPKEEVVTDTMTEEAPVNEDDVMDGMDVTDEDNAETAINESFLKMQKLAGVITEAQYNQKKSLIENENKKFTSAIEFPGGYHLNITDKMKQDIKNQLGIGDEDIKFGYEEDSQDRAAWFATIDVNIEALPADKKSSYKDIISKIVRPAKTDDKTPPTNSPKTAKSGLLNKIKSAFSENQLNEALNKDIRQFGQDLEKRLKQAGFTTIITFHPNAPTEEMKTKVIEDPKLVILYVNLDQQYQSLQLRGNAKSAKDLEKIVKNYQVAKWNGPKMTFGSGWDTKTKQVIGGFNPGDIVGQDPYIMGPFYDANFMRYAVTQTKVATTKGNETTRTQGPVRFI